MRADIAAGFVLAALCAAGCGGSDDEPGNAANSGASQGAAKAPAAPAAGQAQGNVTFCVGKDTTGSISESIKAFEQANANATVRLLELPESQDEARAQIVQRQRAKSPECDVIGMDPTQVAEYAAQGWLTDVTSAVEENKDTYIPSTVASALYQDKYWGFPYVSDTGFLYYRTDKVSKAPESWEQVYADAKAAGGLVYQGAKYEGLTCTYLELLFGAGGSVLSEDASTVAIDSPEARKALDLMVSGLKDGAVPKAVLTYMEEESRRAFESGRAALMRNWPYAYALSRQSKIKNDFEAVPVPGFEGHDGASVLGGLNLGISAFSENKEDAIAFALFMGGEEAQQIAGERSFPPTRTDAYDDPAVREALPFAHTLREAIGKARPRPVSPVYPQISEAIQTHVYAALQGDETPDEAVTGMASDIDKALQTF
jgi:multiple sugar transport system substrate-binding protein